MAHESIRVPYNLGLARLEKILTRVRRPGDFFAHGSLELPMPRVEVAGTGVLSFPVPGAQVQQLIRQAEHAPYGRGRETIVDTSVRKVWQVPSDKVRVGGKSWDKSLRQILDIVANGLGCAHVPVTADLYKLVVYDPGSFFLAHRDTEKTPGMFATLVIVLPCPHRGGQLIIHHAGREVALDLSSAEVSEMTFAAFYADCAHEVKPVTEGNRVCLIYNLIQHRSGTRDRPLTAPLYHHEVASATAHLKTAFSEDGAPAKLAWLLEHHYSQAELSFDTLKNADLALARVLREAAAAADCAAHLGIVHIEEYGPAEPSYDDHWSGSRRGGRYHEEDVVEDADSEDFEVIEVSDGRRYVDQWRDSSGRAMDFGELPLKDGEVLPAGALDGETPDEQRLTEATGNEGASFERAYHRAALLIWPRDRFADVLLQAGVGAALPYLQERIEGGTGSSAGEDDQRAAAAIAQRIIATWQAAPPSATYRDSRNAPSRAEMIRLLRRLDNVALLEQFIGGVVTPHYDGSENEALAAAAPELGATKAGHLFARLARENMRGFHRACVQLLAALIHTLPSRPTAEWRAALRDLGAAIVEALPALARTPTEPRHGEWWRTEKVRAVDGAMVAELLSSLAALEAPSLREAAGAAIVGNAPVFHPGRVIVPALATLHEERGGSASPDGVFERLWIHATEFLLGRSERPPEPPPDWRQPVTLACRCQDCRELQKFALDPLEQTHRFRVRQDRRQHLHGQIERHGLDMTHVTERTGSPHTLECTKTVRTFERQCARHRQDLAWRNLSIGTRQGVHEISLDFHACQLR
jgi:2OG-Fe(II) oxygenase superfamily